MAIIGLPGGAAPSPVSPQPPVLHGLGQRLIIEMAADSWTNLCAQAKPTFTWKGRDMIWVETDALGIPSFRMNCAYLYQRAPTKVQWVLLGVQEGPWDESYAQVMGDNLKGAARLHSIKPASDHGSGDYAIVLATSDRLGTVYEVGWQKLMANGTSLGEAARRFYLHQDRQGQWTLLGEGPEESRGKSGSYRSFATTSTPRVEWIGTNRIPCNIAFEIESQQYEWESSDEPPRPLRRPLLLYEEAVLEGNTPRLRPLTSRPFLRAVPGDTLAGLVEQLSSWTPRAESATKEALQRLQMQWQEGLLRLNAGVDFSTLASGSKIAVLTYAEIASWR